MWNEPIENFKITDPSSFFRDSINDEPNEILYKIRFTKDKVEKSLRKIEINASAGPDGVPGILLNKLAEQLAEPLVKIYSDSMNSGEFLWKNQFTIPGLKPNSPKNRASSYRPISLTSLIGKNMERIVLDEMIPFLERNSIISLKQHGFKRKHSCLTQLIEHHNIIINAILEGKNIDTIYTDFQKAFLKCDIFIYQ